MDGPFNRAIQREIDMIEMTSQITAAFVGHNTTAISDLPMVIASVHGALSGLGQAPAAPEPAKIEPAVSVRSSIKPHALISLIDGKPYKMLRRHLHTNGYTEQSYRETFGLPASYPMVAAEYAEKRRALALSIGLGHHRAKR